MKSAFRFTLSLAALVKFDAAGDGYWFFRDQDPLSQQSIEGREVSTAVVDFDHEGIPDFLGGAEDGRFHYLASARAHLK